MLTPLGYSIVEADSGTAALRCVMAQDFAVILLDVRMPIMDGFETAAHIRQRRQSEMTPIIFITAHGSDEIVNTDLYAEGAVDFIFAPVPPNELRAKVSVFANLFTKAASLPPGREEVQTSADQLRLLTDAAPIGIFQTDADDRYVYTNPRWTEITGIPPRRRLGRTGTRSSARPGAAGAITELPDEQIERGRALPAVRDSACRARRLAIVLVDLGVDPGRRRWHGGLGRNARRRHRRRPRARGRTGAAQRRGAVPPHRRDDDGGHLAASTPRAARPSSTMRWRGCSRRPSEEMQGRLTFDYCCDDVELNHARPPSTAVAPASASSTR